MHQIISFLAAGMIAALLNILSRIFFSQYFDYQNSIIFAFFIGLSAGFLLMKEFVFPFSNKPLAYQFVKFTLVNFFTLGLTLLVSIILYNLLSNIILDTEIRKLASHSLGVLAPIFMSFIIHKFYTFR